MEGEGHSMKQYCRYCIHLYTGNGVFCDAKEINLRESTTKTANNCKLFDFCEVDAYMETDGYKPRSTKRIKKQKKDGAWGIQIELEVEG